MTDGGSKPREVGAARRATHLRGVQVPQPAQISLALAFMHALLFKVPGHLADRKRKGEPGSPTGYLARPCRWKGQSSLFWRQCCGGWGGRRTNCFAKSSFSESESYSKSLAANNGGLCRKMAKSYLCTFEGSGAQDQNAIKQINFIVEFIFKKFTFLMRIIL